MACDFQYDLENVRKKIIQFAGKQLAYNYYICDIKRLRFLFSCILEAFFLASLTLLNLAVIWDGQTRSQFWWQYISRLLLMIYSRGGSHLSCPAP